MFASRSRYLVAMGLLPSLTGACDREATSTGSALPSGDAASSRAEVDASSASSPVVDGAIDASTGGHATASRDGGAHTRAVPSEPGNERRVAPALDRIPRCPSGEYCVTAPIRATAAAAAPFANCEEQAFGPDVPHPGTFDPTRTAAERQKTPDACCYRWHIPCPGGRPLRAEDGRVVCAAPVARGDWAADVALAPGTVHALDADVRARLTAYWLDQAASEHASVASFNRFALQLLALGAPASLVTAAVEAALDEVRHAELCYGLASRYAEQRVGPGKLPLPSEAIAVDPVTVALETLREGCLGESLASELAREASEYVRDPAIAVSLTRIAEDEARHAELAWRAVAWLVGAHGEAVRAAVEAFASELVVDCDDDATAPAAGGEGVLHHGVLGERRQRERKRAVIHDVVLPCLHALTRATLAA